MQRRDEQRMVEGLKKHNYETFWEINQALCDRGVNEFKKFAIRVYNNRHHTYVQMNVDVNKPTSLLGQSAAGQEEQK